MELVDAEMRLCREIFREAVARYLRQQQREDTPVMLGERPTGPGSEPLCTPWSTCSFAGKLDSPWSPRIAMARVVRAALKRLYERDAENPHWTRVYFRVARNNRATRFEASLCLY